MVNRPDSYNDYVIYVNPLQYNRICRRRLQRDRQSLRRGKSRNIYVQIAVRDDIVAPKYSSSRVGYHANACGYNGSMQQGFIYYGSSPYNNVTDYPYIAVSTTNAPEPYCEVYSDATTFVAGSSEAGSYPCSVISGSTVLSKGSEANGHSDTPKSIASVPDETVSGYGEWHWTIQNGDSHV